MAVARRKKTRRRQSGVASLLIMLAVIFMCVFCSVVISKQRTRSRELAETERALQQRIDEANLEAENLVALEQYMHTNQYIEDMAKEKLGLVYPDEIVIKPSK